MNALNGSDRIRHIVVALLSVISLVLAQRASAVATAELAELSLEELLQVTVTSVARKPQALSQSSAAIFVVSQNDIRRSGARTIPDVLRMVPGIQVAQVDSSTWAVTARGSNGIFANKLLVLMDGRTVYDPLFSGVYWDSQDTDLASIDRIEVIRGPGGALWGANAVNGVINIITKNAAETKGLSVSVAAGTATKFETTARVGGNFSDNIDYRFFGKYFSRDGYSEIPSNSNPYDEWDMSRVGGRIDWTVGAADLVTVTGEYYDGNVGENALSNSVAPPYSVSNNTEIEPAGGFVTLGWGHEFSTDSNLDIKIFYDHRERLGLSPNEERDTLDLDVQHRFKFTSRHDIVWGFGIRNSSDMTRGDETISLNPADRTQRLYSGFVQDEIRLVGEALFLTVGTKVEKNNFSPSDNPEWSPSARLSWIFSDTSTLWAAFSRAVRTPSRIEQNARILGFVEPPPMDTFGLPFATTINGNPQMDNEEVVSYELGYRAQPFERLTVDIALFYNDYSDLRQSAAMPLVCQPTGLPIIPAPAPGCFIPVPPDFADPWEYTELPIMFMNGGDQETKGVEIAASYSATDWWRLNAAYSYLKISGDGPGSEPFSAGEDAPEHQFSLRSNMNIGDSVNLDIWARYVDDLKIQGVDSYVGLDTRVAWQILPSIEISLIGRNLLDSSHLEFREEFGSNVPVEIDREVIAELIWQF